MRISTVLSLAVLGTLATLVGSVAHAAPAMTSWGGALDPVTGCLAVGLGGAVLWKARMVRARSGARG
jgi:hypothetical protein